MTWYLCLKESDPEGNVNIYATYLAKRSKENILTVKNFCDVSGVDYDQATKIENIIKNTTTTGTIFKITPSQIEKLNTGNVRDKSHLENTPKKVDQPASSPNPSSAITLEEMFAQMQHMQKEMGELKAEVGDLKAEVGDLKKDNAKLKYERNDISKSSGGR